MKSTQRVAAVCLQVVLLQPRQRQVAGLGKAVAQVQRQVARFSGFQGDPL